jgi:hypothetical protein
MIRFARSILSIPTELTHHFLECQAMPRHGWLASIRRGIQLTNLRLVPKPRLFPARAAGRKIAVNRKTSRKILKRTLSPLDTTTTYFPMIEFLMGPLPGSENKVWLALLLRGCRIVGHSTGTRHEHSGIQHPGVC